MNREQGSLYPEKTPLIITITKFAGNALYVGFNIVTLGVPEIMRRRIARGQIMGVEDGEGSPVTYIVFDREKET